MKSFCIAWLVAMTSLIVTPLTALAQGGTNSGDKPAQKAPVGDFDPPRNRRTQIIDDGPTVHAYRAAPHGHWTGAYQPEVSTENACVKRLTISEDKNGIMTVHALIAGFPNQRAADIPAKGPAKGYKDCNRNGEADTLLSVFYDAKFKPLILIKREPLLKGSDSVTHYEYITYTCYMTDFHQRLYAYLQGRLKRKDDSKHR